MGWSRKGWGEGRGVKTGCHQSAGLQDLLINVKVTSIHHGRNGVELVHISKWPSLLNANSNIRKATIESTLKSTSVARSNSLCISYEVLCQELKPDWSHFIGKAMWKINCHKCSRESPVKTSFCDRNVIGLIKKTSRHRRYRKLVGGRHYSATVNALEKLAGLCTSHLYPRLPRGRG